MQNDEASNAAAMSIAQGPQRNFGPALAWVAEFFRRSGSPSLIPHPGLGVDGCMKQASEYRDHAQECRVLAARMESPDQRGQLIKMAEHWEKLAEERIARLNKPQDPPDR